jgi:hypothetical protein
LQTAEPEATTKNVARAEEDSSAGRVEGITETKVQITMGCEAKEVRSTR